MQHSSLLRFINNLCYAWKLSCLLKVQTNRSKTTGPPRVSDNESGFPGKSIALQHVFYIAVALKIKILKQAKKFKAKEQMCDINNTK